MHASADSDHGARGCHALMLVSRVHQHTHCLPVDLVIALIQDRTSGGSLMKQDNQNKTTSMLPRELPTETLHLVRGGQTSDVQPAPIRTKLVSNPPT
jgi:hypothetical protein